MDDRSSVPEEVDSSIPSEMTSRSRRGSTVALVIGWSAVAFAIVTAYGDPATAYELSIVDGTPLPALLSLGLGFGIGLERAVRRRSSMGLILVGFSILLVALSPVLRNFYFVGGDSLFHMGSAKAIGRDGYRFQIIYPLSHVLSLILSMTTGMALRRSMLLLSPLFVGSFLLFVPLSVRRSLSSDRQGVGTVYGGLVAVMLLPLNWLGTHLSPHPSSLATFFGPIIIFATIVYLGSGRRVIVGILLLLAPTFAFLHPQQGIMFVPVFAVTAVVLLFAETRGLGFRAREHWGYFILLSIGWSAITIGHILQFEFTVDIAVDVILNVFLLHSPAVSDMASRGTGLSEIGYSVFELAVKIFTPGIVIGAFAGLAWLRSAFRVLRRSYDWPDQVVVIVGLGTVPAIGMTGVFLVGGKQTLYLRYFGLAMVFVSVIGGIAIARAASGAGSRALFDRLVAMVVIGLVVFSLPIMQPTPYIAKASGHVTETHIEGFAWTFDHENSSIEIVGIRTLEQRYRQAITGDEATIIWRITPFHFNNQSVSTAYDSERYLTVTSKDVAIDTRLYKGYRFTDDDFRYLDRDPAVDRVMTNGGYALYLITPSERGANPEVRGRAGAPTVRNDRDERAVARPGGFGYQEWAD